MFKFLKSVILKTFNEIVLAFLSVESKTNILYVNIKFTGKLLLGFGRCCGKVFQEATVFHLSEGLHSQIMVFQYFFQVDFFFFFFKQLVFKYFSYKWFFLDQTYSFKNKELVTITKNADIILFSSVLWNFYFLQNFKANRPAALVLALGKDDSLWLILLLAHDQNSPDTLLLRSWSTFAHVTYFI